ncbi:Cytochrome b5-like heme/steroid binding domain [Pseudocohnilembus persalinus]|uniref:Cytochrome b5-like heme/steroid binding domain n=1 Tax=Pseudocohnilembus persalinus TaxID=266149 RepID=A0A0V0QTF1_PSEPJ|nr:Cytochrome b5-like heme/steroid binding domain [Pseudocohnilembus persalinus]|eukprot:KRX05534.1 Cytochrome b5-like heme/steroid binding domain [Pseudocohnilembus persalinus]
MSTEKAQQEQQIQKQSKDLWHLYGNTYDLSSFMEKHPGGKQILQVTRGHLDITPMFESYHAFADLDKLKQDLATYQVGKSEYPQKYTFNKGEFYDVVRERVRKYFGTEKNVNHKVKINAFWFTKVSIITILYLASLYFSFFTNYSTKLTCLISFISGWLLIAVGMCVYHDASHFALFQRNFEKNDVFTRIVGAFLLFRPELWMTHHSFRHHAYTGDENLDPDIINYQPFIRKVDRVPAKKYMKYTNKILGLVTCITMWLLPGQGVGQALIYEFTWRIQGRIWRMSYPKEILNRRIYERLILIALVFMHLYKFNIFVTICYFIGYNMAYSLAIVPDHDTNQTHQNFDPSRKDWGETQVRNSGNFGNKVFFDLYNHIFGGINYQIEHHLFPSMCNVHLNQISPIVQETCKEFNVPYVSHISVISAYKDFLKGIMKINQ